MIKKSLSNLMIHSKEEK